MTTVEKLKYKYDKLLEDDNYLRHYNNTLIEQINKLNEKIVAAHAEGNAEGFAEGVEFTTMELALDNCVELNNCAVALARGKAKGAEGGVPPITNANNEKPETSANNPHEQRMGI